MVVQWDFYYGKCWFHLGLLADDKQIAQKSSDGIVMVHNIGFIILIDFYVEILAATIAMYGRCPQKKWCFKGPRM